MNGIMKYINRISRCNGVVYANRLRGYGITQCQHPYILLICREPGIPQEKISRELCVNKSSVTRQITLMEEKGLIMRKQDPTGGYGGYIPPRRCRSCCRTCGW